MGLLFRMEFIGMFVQWQQIQSQGPLNKNTCKVFYVVSTIRILMI